MKRTIVATLMLATLGGCRMPDDGPDMPVSRPPSSSRSMRGSSYYNRTNWQAPSKEDADEDTAPAPKPKSTAQTARPATSRSTAVASRGGCANGYCNSDDSDLRLNDPATRDLIQATMTKAGSTSSTVRTASRSTVSQDTDYPPHKTEYTSAYRRPQSLPADVQRATPLDRSTASATSLNSGRLTEMGKVTPTSMTRTAAARASGGKLSLVNTRHIHLRYALDKVVTASSSSIEVWGTRDMRSWKRYPLVSDSGVRTAEGRSDTGTACLVEVEGEGVYGFTLCGTGGAGSSRAPRPGDVPQLWVAVDTTRPSVRLISNEVQDQDNGRKVVVRWTAQDANLGEHPIALSYALKPGGPWTPIARSLANNGRYEWTVPPQVNSFVHLRVQATDMMGNVGSAEGAAIYIREREAMETRDSMALPPAINTQSASPTAVTSSEPAQPELMGASGDDR